MPVGRRKRAEAIGKIICRCTRCTASNSRRLVSRQTVSRHNAREAQLERALQLPDPGHGIREEVDLPTSDMDQVEDEEEEWPAEPRRLAESASPPRSPREDIDMNENLFDFDNFAPDWNVEVQDQEASSGDEDRQQEVQEQEVQEDEHVDYMEPARWHENEPIEAGIGFCDDELQEDDDLEEQERDYVRCLGSLNT